MEKLTLILKDGKKLTVKEETGKYYICGKTQFRKNSPMIERVDRKVQEEKPLCYKEVRKDTPIADPSEDELFGNIPELEEEPAKKKSKKGE